MIQLVIINIETFIENAKFWKGDLSIRDTNGRGIPRTFNMECYQFLF